MATLAIKWTRRPIKLALILLVLAATGLGVRLLAGRDGGAAASAADQQNRPSQAVPVLAATATETNVPIIVRGIGSVQAFNTVTVKSRVDGNIVKVAFTEGQFVHAGDLLVEVDQRPFQAQLEQAEANKAKDEANLENAQRDLARYAAILKDNLA